MKFTIDKKISSFIVCIIFALALILGYYFLWNQKRVLNLELDERISVLLNNLALNLEYPVLVGDREAIARLVGGVTAQKDIVYCRVEGKGGEALSEAGAKEKSLARMYTALIVTKAVGEAEDLLLSVPAESNEELGKVFLTASLSGLNRKISEVQSAIAAVVIIVMILSSLGAYWLLKRIIGKPIALLVEATERISRGDLNHKIPMVTRDELGALANSFNRMTGSLREAQEELVGKEKLSILGQLSGSVGHELRNPLGVMSNAVYFLKMVNAEADETTREYLDIIKQEIDNSQRIITDLLDFARTKPPQRQLIAAGKLVRQSIEMCALPDVVTVSVDIPEALPKLNIDPLQMGQVFQNLIMNACQAMPGGGELRVSAKTGFRDSGLGVGEKEPIPNPQTPNPDGNFAEISVSDTGTGISPENMKKLFHPLFTTKPKGIGLGLVVCKNLTEVNGGRIEVASQMGKGTTFTVILPVEREGA